MTAGSERVGERAEGGRSASVRARLARYGFTDVDVALPRLHDLARSDTGALALAELLGDTADPDAALLGLVRLVEAVPDGDDLPDRLRDVVVDDRDPCVGPGPIRRLVRVMGASRALTDHVVRHPASWRRVAPRRAGPSPPSSGASC